MPCSLGGKSTHNCECNTVAFVSERSADAPTRTLTGVCKAALSHGRVHQHHAAALAHQHARQQLIHGLRKRGHPAAPDTRVKSNKSSQHQKGNTKKSTSTDKTEKENECKYSRNHCTLLCGSPCIVKFMMRQQPTLCRQVRTASAPCPVPAVRGLWTTRPGCVSPAPRRVRRRRWMRSRLWWRRLRRCPRFRRHPGTGPSCQPA